MSKLSSLFKFEGTLRDIHR